MDPTETEFFAKAPDDPAGRPSWIVPLLALVVAIGAIVAWRVLVKPPAAPVTVQDAEPEPAPVVKAPAPSAPTFSAPPSTERPEKPPAPPKDFEK